MKWPPEERQFSSWADLAAALTTDALSEHRYYRGTLPEWDLETSLERALNDWGLPLSDAPRAEWALLRDFKRGFLPVAEYAPPHDDDVVGWLALMQHHGAPTRLLDWTYSPFVAAYFAVEALLSVRRSTRAVVWAIPCSAFDSPGDLVSPPAAKELIQKFCDHRDGESFSGLFFKHDPRLSFVLPVNPSVLNQRLIIQQGVFLAPGNVTIPFMQNLEAAATCAADGQPIKYIIDRSAIRDAMHHLRRMNMTRASLFPGLDGYAQNLRLLTRFYGKDVVYTGTEKDTYPAVGG